MSFDFLNHHGFRYWGDPGDGKQFSQESIFHKIWVTFLLLLFFIVLFIVL